MRYGQLLNFVREAKPKAIDEIRLWNIAQRSNEAWATLTGHVGTVSGLAYSPDDRYIASCADDQTIRIWDPITGREERALSSNATILGLAFAPDDQMLAAATEGHGVQLLDLPTVAVKRTLRTRGRGPSRLKFSPDGRKLATSNIWYGGYEADNRVWSLDVDEGSLDVSPSGDAVWFAFSTDSRHWPSLTISGPFGYGTWIDELKWNAFPRTLALSKGCSGCRMDDLGVQAAASPSALYSRSLRGSHRGTWCWIDLCGSYHRTFRREFVQR